MNLDTQYVYRPRAVSFTVDGTSYDVSYINFALALNQVPTCEVGIAPANAEGDIRINTLNLVSLKKAFSALTEKAVQLASSSVHAELYSINGGPEQTLDLSGWLLVSCGMDNVSSVDAFSLSCVIAHPAFKLNLYTGCFFNGVGVLDFEKQVDGVSDPIDAAEKTIDVMMEANEKGISTICEPLSMASTPLKDPNAIKKELADGMGILKGLISGSGALVKWDAGYTGGSLGVPCSDLGDPVNYGIKYALLEAWTLTVGDQSFWGKLTGQGILGDFFLEVVPTYHDTALTVAPFNPYGGPSVSMPSGFVSMLNMPGFDPQPLYGVIMYQGMGTAEPSGSVTFWDMSSAAAVIQPVNIAFIPAASQFAGGELIHTGDPAWISVAMTRAASRQPVIPRGAGGDTYDQSKKNPEQIDREIKKSLRLWNQVRLRYLNARFMSEYRSAVEAHLSCAFCVRTPDGQEPLPGSILSFQSGGELFHGQISTVVHNIDCANSRATTQIGMGYCDVDEGTSNVLGSSPTIPFYHAVEVLDTGGAEDRS